MLSWYVSASFEACFLIFLPGCDCLVNFLNKTKKVIYKCVFMIYKSILQFIILATTDLTVIRRPAISICKIFLDLVKRLGFLLLAFRHLFWNDVKTVKESFSSVLNTESIFLPQATY